MNTTLKGTEYERCVFGYFSKLLEKGSLPFANKSYSELFYCYLCDVRYFCFFVFHH